MKLTILSAALLLGAPSLQAAVSITNAFFGPTTTPQVSVSGLLAAGASDTEIIGPGWDTTVTVGVGLVAYTAAFMPGDGTYTVGSGGLAGVLNSAVTERTFAGQTVDANSVYTVTLGVEDAAFLSVLGVANIQLGYMDGGSEVYLANSVNGTGLLGLADLVGLFSGSDTATFQVTSGAGVPAGSDLFVRLQTSTVATVLGSDFTFTGLSVETVPEPSVAALGGLAVLSFALRRKRRSA